MQKIMLKQLSLDMGKPEYEMLQRIPAVENGFTNPAYNLSYDEYKEWLSIVRFRTAIKEPLDIAFLFWSIAVGIVLAAGMIPLAIIGSVIVGVILLLFVNRTPSRNPYIVVIRCADHASETAAKKFLESRTERFIVKGKTAQKGQVELNMEIRLRDDNTDFINELSDMKGVESAVLVSYNGDYMG